MADQQSCSTARSGSAVYAILLCIMWMFVAVLVACTQDPNAEANKLFVKAHQLADKAETEKNSEVALTMLRDAERHLRTIISDYPTSTLAVQLASGQSIGKLSLSTILAKIEGVQDAICLTKRSKSCVLAKAAQLARSSFAEGSEPASTNKLRPGNFQRATLLIELALAQHEAGLRAESRKTFELASRDLAAAKSEQYYAQILAPFLRALAKLDRSAEAREYVKGEAGQALAKHIKDIAEGQIAGGFTEAAATSIKEALRLGYGAGDRRTRAIYLPGIALIQARAGLSQDAKASLAELTELIATDSYAAAAQRPTGQSWNWIPPPGYDRYVLIQMLAGMSEAQNALAETAAAKATVEKLLSLHATQAGNYRSNDIANVLISWSTNGSTLAQFVDITDVTSDVSEPMKNRLIFLGITARVEAGRVAEARLLLPNIKSDHARALAFAALAGGHAKLGQKVQADEAIGSAVDAMKTLTPVAQSGVLIAISKSLRE